MQAVEKVAASFTRPAEYSVMLDETDGFVGSAMGNDEIYTLAEPFRYGRSRISNQSCAIFPSLGLEIA